MTWERTTDLVAFNLICVKANSAYADQTVEGLQNILDNLDGEFWIWSERLYKIALCVFVREGVGKVGVMTPNGNFDPETALKIAWAKVREIMDRKGLKVFYGSPLADYGDNKLNSFFGLIRKICWELEEGSESDTKPGGYFRYNFERKHERKSEDVVFSGPEMKGKKITRSNVKLDKPRLTPKRLAEREAERAAAKKVK